MSFLGDAPRARLYGARRFVLVATADAPEKTIRMVFIQVQMHFQKLHEFFASGGVISKAIGILENASADHKTVYFWVLCVEF